jgi:polyisoprenoid-binding protein YceI
MRIRSVCQHLLALITAVSLGAVAQTLSAAEYNVDPAHSFVQFRIKHLGYSTLVGRFNDVSGEFTHDPADPEASTITVEIDAASVDTNHAERDKDLRSENFLDVEKFPKVSFVTTKYTGDDQSGTLEGTLTLHGVTKPVSLDVKKIGEGDDPWGGYRAGFEGTTSLTRKDFDMGYNLGPASESLELELFVEGIRK